MKKKSNAIIHSFLVLILLFFVLTACPPPVDPPVLPTLTTTVVGSITAISAISGGNISLDGEASITARGVCWGTTVGPTIANSKTLDGTGIGNFSSTLTGLNPGVTYYIRAYATNSVGTSYGNEISFTVLANLPTVTTNTASIITATTATSGGNVTEDGGGSITARGLCWSTVTNPTVSNSKTTDGTGIGSFVSSLTALIPGAKYYFKAYATNSAGTSYGNEISFTTLANLPTLTTTSATSITTSTATSGGNIMADGGGIITARGVCWGTVQNPTTSNAKTTDGTNAGSFTSNITGLQSGITYYVRAYATNSTGTSYGNEISFKTSSNLPTISTLSVTSITSTTATSGGNIATDGGATITVKGICWSTSPGPAIANSMDGIGTDSFKSSLAGLSPGTKYYVRAYATNSVGTAYGNEISFTTLANLPTVSTTLATSITSSTTTTGGNITSDGGGAINARGVCWDTISGPSIEGNTTNEGSGTGNFTSSITGLNPGITYYVRAYATNSSGTSYGNEISFKTNANLPIVTTIAISSIGTGSAISGGNVINDGGATITARGVCWSTSTEPTIISSKTNNSGTTGTFTSSIAGITAKTTYYVRAFATNSVGTAYGTQVSFTTIIPPLSVTDVDGNVYNTVTIGSQVWLSSNLKTTKYNDGTAIQLVTENAIWANLSTPGYCWYNNDSYTNKNNYGALYNWFAVNTGKLCPTGSHVPSYSDWIILTNFVGGWEFAGDKLKESGSSHWLSPNLGATNAFGFTALPGNERNDFTGIFGSGGGYTGHWWSSKENNTNAAWGIYMGYEMHNVLIHYWGMKYGFSVRCLVD